MRSLRLVLLSIASLALAATPALATPVTDSQSWPQFRGPDRDGTVGAEGLAEAWPAEGPVELWRRAIGSGFSTVVVSGGVAYTMEAVGEEEAVLALDAATGETKWRTVVGVPMESEFGRGPRSTPALAGGKLFTVSSQSRLVALNAASGELVWDQDLTRFSPTPRFGYALSPLVVGDVVVVDVGTKDLVDAAREKAEAEAAKNAPPAETPDADADGAVEGEPASKPEIEVPPQMGAAAGFHVATGELVWRGGFPGPAGYSSPIVLTLSGVPQMVYVRRDSAVGVDFQGNELWTYETEPTAAIVMPVQLADDVIFISSSDDHFGGKALRVARADDGTWSVEEAWSERLMRNHFNTSVAVDGVLYGFDNTTMKALDGATGQRLWAHRGFGKGSLVAAGQLLYVLGDTGELALVKATPDDFVQAGSVQATTGKAWTSPSLAKGTIFVRDHDEIAAFDVRAASLAARAQSATAPAASEDAALAEARQAAQKAAQLSADELLGRFAAARGGREAWTKVQSVSMSGTYEAFSETSDFVLRRARHDGQDLFYLHYTVFGAPAVRAVDAEGPWLQHKFLSPEPLRVGTEPQIVAYMPQMLREAQFGPLLLDAAAAGLKVETVGVGEINGRPTVDLKVTFPATETAEPNGETQAEPAVEIWHLDPVSFLEVAVDSHVFDYTQGGQPFLQRAYYGDFRQVGGVMLPFQLDLEFNARFERMEVESAEVDAGLTVGDFAMPAPPPSAEESASGN